MLSKEVFNQGVKALMTEYKGFEMNKERSIQWYGFMENMTNKEFQNKINDCIINCNHVPYMADIINAKEPICIPNAGARKEYRGGNY